MAIGRRVSRRGTEAVSGMAVSIADSSQLELPPGAVALQETDDGGAHPGESAVPAAGIDDDVGAIEGGAEHGSLRHVAAIAAADAGIVDCRDGIVLERIVRLLDRERG